MSSTVELILLGTSGVGKTALISKYFDDAFNEEDNYTTSINFKKKTLRIDGKSVTIRIWDTAGQEKFRSMSTSYVKRADGIICVFSLSDQRTLENAQYWISSARDLMKENTPIILVGNKADLDTGCIPKNEIDTFVRDMGVEYFKTSAKTGKNVEKVFTDLARKVIGNNKNKEDHPAPGPGQNHRCC